MTGVNISFPDFSSGEISPRLYGRHDLQAYYKGARRVENFICQTVGPAHYRTGTIFASRTAGNNPAFFWLFEFTDALSFVLEFTAGKIRFYRNNGQVRETAQAITGVTKASPAVVTYSGADNYSNGDSVFIDGIVGMTELNGYEYTVANVNVGANTFELSGVNSTGYSAYTSGGEVSVITEVTTSYAEADLFELKFAQNGVDLYIAHPSYNPQKLTYASATSWSIANHSPTALTLGANDYPSAVTLYEQRLVYGGSNNNPQTLFFSKSGDLNNFTTGTGVTDGISYTVNGDGNTIKWLRGTNKFLAVGTFGDVLQVTGGTDDVITPTSISVKPTNSFGVANINPVGRGNQIFYIQRNKLILRSYEYDFQADSYVPVDRNITSDHITSSGVTQISYQEGRPNILWCTKNNGDLVGMTIEDMESISGWHRQTTTGDIISVISTPRVDEYNQLWMCVKRGDDYFVEYMSDPVEHPKREDYVASDKTTDDQKFANAMFETQKEYIHVDASLSYYGTDAGETASASLSPAAITGTGITFTASAAVFSASDVGRELWKKSVTGAETGRAEITAYNSATSVTCTILEDFDSTTAMDAGNWYLTTDAVTGLDHLEGQLVTIVTDGGQHPQAVVANGSVTLNEQASVIHVGYGYTGYLETNDLEGGGIDGVAQTKRKSVNAIGFRFYETLYAKYGVDYYNLNQVEMRTAAMNMDRPPLLFTGDTKEQCHNNVNDARDGGWSRQKRAIIVQDQPFPCNVQLVIPYMTVSNV